MADQFDRAQELDAYYRRQALAQHKERMPKGDSRTHCLECGGEIPAARRTYLPGVQHCVGCAEQLERQRRP
ncbi:MAG: TraR/DksA family transcriptional regulator [Desulfocapsa sp.]|nr:TraR/DksA family transcriptional regulator [Desulfocapsa sp.]MCG2744257.1 TraR/DksA C4-type zinc finger protein [Desulfobacteraceae bacterium]